MFQMSPSSLVGALPPRRSLFGRLSAALTASQEMAHHYLLVLRYVLVNAFALSLLVVVWLQGWIDLLIAADHTHLVAGIVVLFLVGNAWCVRRLIAVSRELNAIKEGCYPPSSKAGAYLRAIAGCDGAARANLAAVLRAKLFSRIAPVRHIAHTLVVLGLVGTVLGFIIALQGVDPDAASDVTAVGPMIATLIDGMSVALHTTLVGSILNIWLMVNYRLLESGTLRVVTLAVEKGERNARA